MGELTRCTYATLKNHPRKDPKASNRDDRPDEGESWTDLMNRAGDFYEHLIKTYYNQDKEVKILLVTHGGFIKELLNYFRFRAGKAALSFINNSDNVSIHVVKIVGQSIEKLVPRYVIRNDASHLT